LTLGISCVPRFLEEKKKKRLSNAVVQALMNAPKKDHVAFGEVVQAPPQLTFPEKNKVSTLCLADELIIHTSSDCLSKLAIEHFRQRATPYSFPSV